MIEYAVLSLKKDRKKIQDLESYLNKVARRNWKVKCSVGDKLILFRKIKLK